MLLFGLVRARMSSIEQKRYKSCESLPVTYSLPKVPFDGKALKGRKAIKCCKSAKVGKYYVTSVFSTENKVN